MRRPTFESANERYQRDPVFHHVVDLLYSMIHQMDATAADLQEAVMFARIKWETEHPGELAFTLQRPASTKGDEDGFGS